MKTLKRKVGLAKMGKDKARETRKYWPLRRQFLEDHPFCEVPVSTALGYTPACTGRATQIHHMKGQNWRIMNDTKWWMAVCHLCHSWITNNQTKARELGLILYK